MSGPTSRLAVHSYTLKNLRVVWPVKEAECLSETERAFKAIHRIRRQIQVYEVERERNSKRTKLGVAGFAAALACTGLPTFASHITQAAEAPAPLAPPVFDDVTYSLAAPVESEVARLETASVTLPQRDQGHARTASEYKAPPRPVTRYIRPTPVYQGYIRDLIYRYFPASQAEFATRVAWCESSFNPSAVGDQGRARGIFQFWQATFLGTNVGRAAGWDAAFDAETNIRAAAELVARGGWGPWTCARKV